MTAAVRQRFNDSTIQRFNLTIANRQRARPVNLRFLRRIAHTLLVELLPTRKLDLGVCLVAGPEITRLNVTFLHHQGQTDVIAFNYDKSRKPHTLHGEILICVDEAVSQARRFRTTWQSELARYIIHGVLHLRGHDDLRSADRRKMKREENRLLKEIARRFSLSKLDSKPKLST